MDNIKNAFSKVKQDIDNLNKEVSEIKNQVQEINEIMAGFYDQLADLKLFFVEKLALMQNNTPSTHKQNLSTHPDLSVESSTHNLPFKGVKGQISNFSTGNEGVSTDTRQTVRQTLDRQKTPQSEKKPDISQVFTGLESIKSDIQKTLKNLSEKELLVFLTIYQLEEEKILPDYKTISQKLNITPGTVRDHIQRLFVKKTPIFKEKINNKRIILHIQPEFKQMISLQTLIQFKDLNYQY